MSTIKPKHEQVYEILLEALKSGIYPLGKKLPKTAELAQKYSVSINVLVKAIDTLKKNGMVKAKSGDGIYSNYDFQKQQEKTNCSDKHFPRIGTPKAFTVWIEDNIDWQQEFWDSFFTKFMAQNPDIEITVHYGMKDKNIYTKNDLLIGGMHFFNHTGYTMEDCFPVDIIETFYKSPYNNMLVKPEDLKWKGKSSFFPLSLMLPVLLHREKDFKNQKNKNIPDFIQALKDRNQYNPVKYKSWSLQNMMIDCGCCAFDSEKGIFALQNKDHWKTTVNKIRDFYSGSDMLPLHGMSLDYDKIFKDDVGNSISFIEIPINQIPSIKETNLLQAHYPIGDTLPLLAICGFIPKNTQFPEEALRIILSLLNEDNQRLYMQKKLGVPINKQVLADSDFSYLLENCDVYKKVMVVPPSRLIEDAIETILIWDLYYYFNNDLNCDIITRIENKIKYFIDSSANKGE